MRPSAIEAHRGHLLYTLKMNVLTLVLLRLCLVTVAARKSSNGRRFLVLFPESLQNKCQLDLLISTSSIGAVDVDVSAPRRPDIGPTVSVQVSSENSAVVNVHPQLNANGTGINDHGIFVESNGTVSVQAYSHGLDSTGLHTAGSFLVMPVASLGTVYMVITHCEIYSCQFAVAATLDTVVDIDLNIANVASFTYDGVSYGSGDALSVALKAFQIFQVMVDGDLSGTIIRSPRKVAVVVGSDWTSILPASPTEENDYLVEQMPPLNTWGWAYVIAPFPGRTSGDLVALLAAESDCVVTDTLGTTFHLKYRYKFLVELLPGHSFRINSSGRIIVAHFSRSPETLATDTDASMHLVPPIAQWWNTSFTVFTNVSQSLDQSVTAVIYGKEDCAGAVAVAGSVLSASNWTPMEKTDYAYLTLALAEGAVVIEFTTPDCTGLGGYIYGQSLFSALALSVGGYFEELFPVCMATSSDVSVFVSMTSLVSSAASFMTSGYSSDTWTKEQESLFTSQTLEAATFTDSSYNKISDVMSTTSSEFTLTVLPNISSTDALSISSYIQDIPSSLSTSSLPSPQPSPSSSSSSIVSTLTSAVPVSMTTVAMPPTATPRPLGARCGCRCFLNDGAHRTKLRLRLDAALVSRTLRKKSSAPDSRRSAVAIGTVATVFFVLAAGVVLIADCFTVTFSTRRARTFK